jgi:HAD superfamily hydrolase (TIGR01509 family)
LATTSHFVPTIRIKQGGSSMGKIEAVIFDMDGVLIDAKDWHYEALNRALGLFGMEISRYDHLVTYDGLPTRKKLEMLSAERGLPSLLHEFINQLKQQYTMEIVSTRCKPVFYHEYALSKLKSEGYRLVVCSNSVRDSVEAMLDKADLLKYLEFYLSNQDVTHSKPDPEMYQVAMARLGLNPEQCLVLEDNENGIKAVLNSGAHLMRVHSVHDVNYSNIHARIDEIEGQNHGEHTDSNGRSGVIRPAGIPVSETSHRDRRQATDRTGRGMLSTHKAT